MYRARLACYCCRLVAEHVEIVVIVVAPRRQQVVRLPFVLGCLLLSHKLCGSKLSLLLTRVEPILVGLCQLVGLVWGGRQ